MENVVKDILNSLAENRMGAEEKEVQMTVGSLLQNAMNKNKEEWLRMPEEQIHRFAIRLWLQTPGNYYSEEMKDLLNGSMVKKCENNIVEYEDMDVEEKIVDNDFLNDSVWMSRFFERKLHGKDKVLSQNSVFQYKSRIANLLEILGHIEGKISTEDIMERLLTCENYSTTENHLNSLKLLLRNLTESEKRVLIGDKSEEDQMWNVLKEFTDVIKAGKILEKEEKDQNPTDIEIESYVEWEDIEMNVRDFRKSIIEKMDNVLTEELERAIVTSLYVIDCEPRRNEYGALTYIESDNNNYYKDGMVVLNEYKTVTAYGRFDIKLTNETKEMMEELVRRKKEMKVKWIFGKSGMNPQSMWSERMKGYFMSIVDKGLTSRLLRKYRISYLQDNGKLRYMAEKMKVARLMGHSVKEQQEIYTLRLSRPDNVETFSDDDTSSVGEKRKRQSYTRWSNVETEDLKVLFKEYGNDAALIKLKATEMGKLKDRTMKTIRKRIDTLVKNKELMKSIETIAVE